MRMAGRSEVVKFANDVTKQKLGMADISGQISAIGKSQAVIEFSMDGTILTANANFSHDARLFPRGNSGQTSQHVS